MKLGVLLSGGKDSLYAAYKAVQADHEIACCLTIRSTNSESYMFHTPNINGVGLQAEAMRLPLLVEETAGEKEVELDDLRRLLLRAKEEHNITGVVTGAVASQYQASRVQQLCWELDLWCYNPLWQVDQVTLLCELLEHGFEIVFSGIAAYPFDEHWLGRRLSLQVIQELVDLQASYRINPAGEGGELESYVLDCPLFNKKIVVKSSEQQYENHHGSLTITEARLVEKEQQSIKPLAALRSQEDAHVAVISTVSTDPLHEEEFVRPILRAIGGPCRIASLDEIEAVKQDIMIISGCALRDDSFLRFRDEVQENLRGKAILGICAGAELLLPKDHELEEILEIGPQRLEALHEDMLTSKLEGREVFCLHHLGLRQIPLTSDVKGLLVTKKNIAAFRSGAHVGLQFHPEVSCPEVIRRFLQHDQ